MTLNGKLALFMISGPQSGARIRLGSGDTSLGKGFENDIVLGDENIADQALILSVNKTSICVNNFDGNVLAGSEKLSIGQSRTIKPYQVVALGESKFIVGYPDSIEWKSYVAKNKLQYKTSGQESFTKKSNAGRAVIFFCITLVLVASSVLATHYHTRVEEKPSLSDNLTRIDGDLERQGFNNVSATQSDLGILLSGFVSDNKSFGELKKIVAQKNYRIVFDISVGEKLAADVKDVFRTNGINVEVEVLGPKQVLIKTKETSMDNIDKVKKIALADIRDLEVINIKHIVSEKENFGNDKILSGPGKRIVSVVQGEPSYFVTEDKSRYFVGSSLSTGYVIESIVDNAVLVSRNGRTFNLKF